MRRSDFRALFRAGFAAGKAARPPRTVSLPYTCGELVQGRIEGEDFHIPCPLDRRGRVTAAWSRTPVAPPWPHKVRAAVRYLLGETDTHLAPYLRLGFERGAPGAGKGFATSSVDVVGVLLALARLLGQNLDAASATSLALTIDPTDAVALPGLTLFDHRRGKLSRSLGDPPALGIVVLEPRARVSTREFHEQESDGWGDESPWRDAIAQVEFGLATGDAAAIAAAATLSAIRWQSVLNNPWLAPVMEWGRSHGALGACRAHSGTAIGLLFAPDTPVTAPAAVLGNAVQGRARVWTARLSSGGPQ